MAQSVSRKDVMLLEPDLSLPSSSRPRHSESFSYVNKNISSVSSVTCWNCHKQGHIYSFCSSPRKVFCFGCKCFGVIKPKYPKCSKNVQGRGVSVTSVPTTEPTTSLTENSSRKRQDKEKYNFLEQKY